MVLRFGGDAGRYELDGLGFLEPEKSRFAALLAEPQGLLILCGPTGSGKTTTLYSALGHLNQKRGGSVRIATLEDPIELELPFAAQTQIDRLRGMDFAGALRALLRQDPNVLLIGEVRDAESAKIAVQAGLSGHLILTSLHADSSLGVAPRLIDLGIEPFLVASATLGVVAQRQLDGLCPACRTAGRDEPERARKASLPAGTQLWRADGCNECAGKGRKGRRAIFELLRFDESLRRLITQKAPAGKLEQAARGPRLAKPARGRHRRRRQRRSGDRRRAGEAAMRSKMADLFSLLAAIALLAAVLLFFELPLRALAARAGAMESPLGGIFGPAAGFMAAIGLPAVGRRGDGRRQERGVTPCLGNVACHQGEKVKLEIELAGFEKWNRGIRMPRKRPAHGRREAQPLTTPRESAAFQAC